MSAPSTAYAKSGDVHIAYQVLGDGPFDLVFSPSPVSNLEVAWEWPPFARFLRRLASFSRLILFDKRGTGLSDRVTEAATLEERMDDLRAVMDAAGSERAAIFGTSEGGPMSLLFAATYPSRVTALVLYGSYAKSLSSDDYPYGSDPQLFEIGMQMMTERWGQCALIDVFAPSMRDDQAFRNWLGRYERQSASPGAAVAIQRLNTQLDVRPILDAVKVPTLILYRADEYVAHVEGSKYLAEHIEGAQYVELDGADYHPYVGDQDAILDQVEGFLTGSRGALDNTRVLATLLVIGGSDHPLTADTVVLVERIVAGAGGHVASDGRGSLVASFDGPRRALASALEIRDGLSARGVSISVGAHIGEIERDHPRFGGGAEDLTARVQARAGAGEVLVTRTLVDLLAGGGIALADAGVHDLSGLDGVDSSWRLYPVGVGRTEAARPLTDVARRGVFRREGDVWLLSLDGTAVRLRDRKGLADIALLLARSGREVHVAELVDATAMGARPTNAPRLDDRAMAAYRDRITELEETEADAQAANDPVRASRARAELDTIVEQLTSDLGLGGRPRNADDWAERARKAVRTRIANTLKHVEAEHPALGRHLRASISTGAFCSYRPPDPVRWEL